MTKAISLLVILLLGVGVGGGCASPRQGSTSDDLSAQVREAFKQNKVAVPPGYQNEGERRSSYPGGTTAAEWKSLSSPEK